MGSVKASCRVFVLSTISYCTSSSCFETKSSKITQYVQHHSRSSLWFHTAFLPMAAVAKPILLQLLLALQFCLGVWQIIKFTPLGGLLECIVKRWVLLPLGFSTPYAHLQGFPGLMYKTVTCHITISSSPHELPVSKDPLAAAEEADLIKTTYLQKSFHLERRGDELFVNGDMAYYLTDAVWPSVMEMAKAAPRTVFLKGYKEFWQQVATGGVMSFWEVLDNLILDNHTLLRLDNDLFLPVNLSVSEEKLLKFLNLAGLFLQTKQQLPWFYPSLLSFTAAILEFCTPLRVWLYNGANRIFCCTIQALAENVLSRQWRRQVYALGLWVENLKPSNDIELRVLKGRNVCAVIAGGAKVLCKEGTSVVSFHVEDDDAKFLCKEGASVGPFHVIDDDGGGGGGGDRDDVMKVDGGDGGGGGDRDDVIEMDGADPLYNLSCYPQDGNHIALEARFRSKEKKCWVRARTVAWVEVECTFTEFKKLKTFLACVAKHRSGSLKICDGHSKVRVRNFRESVLCYFKNRCPTVYELHMEKATIK